MAVDVDREPIDQVRAALRRDSAVTPKQVIEQAHRVRCPMDSAAPTTKILGDVDRTNDRGRW